jgi:hypothetical protein
MDSTPVDFSAREASRLMVVGMSPLVLRGHGGFAPRQLWLPFIQAIILSEPEPPPLLASEVKKRERYEKNPAVREVFDARPAHVPDHSRYLYNYERGVHQIVMPFPSHMKISVNEFSRLQAADFPSFERMADGGVWTIRYLVDKREDMLIWCTQNCRGRYHIKPTFAVFEYSEDAAIASLAI